MKNKKLEKKTVFLFKKKSIANLSKEQMRKINGGSNPTTENPVSTGTNICNETLNQTISL